MNNKIYCSSGTIVGRINNYNYRLFTESISEIEADGFELMMVAAYYPVLSELISAVEGSGAPIPVIHAEKDIGEAFAESDHDVLKRAFDAFEINCRVGKHFDSEKIVLHLWSGLVSDRFFANNLSALPYLYDIASKYSLELLIENVPCVLRDPFTNLSEIDEKYPYSKFIFDTRFGAFHEQTDRFLSSEWLTNGKIAHMHFSDYVGPAHDFSSLRPIPHLGCGLVGFDSIMPTIAEKYHGSITLVSPELHADGPDTEKLNLDLRYIRKWVRKQ